MSKPVTLAIVESHPSLSVFSIPGFSEPFSSLVHLLGAGIFLVLGIVWLIRERGGVGRTLAVFVFVFGVLFLLSMSGVFHLLTPDTASRAVLQRLDHAGIFILIAATFTPMHVMEFSGPLRWGVLIFIWGAAVSGIVLKSIYFSALPEWLGLSLYLGLGWVGVLSAYALYRQFGFVRIRLILLGALAYTVGALVDAFRLPMLVPGVIGPHEFFHIMVLVGIASHWTYIRRVASGRLVPISDWCHRPSPISAPPAPALS